MHQSRSNWALGVGWSGTVSPDVGFSTYKNWTNGTVVVVHGNDNSSATNLSIFIFGGGSVHDDTRT